MPASKVLLDTTILSAIMKGNEAVMPKARTYLIEHGAFSFSIITRYEILRGLKAKSAVSQEASFNRLCGASEVLALSDDIVVKAAEVYAALRVRGELIGDADILIRSNSSPPQLGGRDRQRRPFSAYSQPQRRELASRLRV